MLWWLRACWVAQNLGTPTKDIAKLYRVTKVQKVAKRLAQGVYVQPRLPCGTHVGHTRGSGASRWRCIARHNLGVAA